MRILALLLCSPLLAQALIVEVVAFGWDGHYRRGRPAPLTVKVTSETPFRGDLEIAGGPVRHLFPLDLPAHSVRELRVVLQFAAPAEASWRAGTESGGLALDAKEVGPGEALVASERAAVGRRADRYRADCPPGSRFFFAEFPRDASQELFAAVDVVILQDRGAGRAEFLASLEGAAAFRARGGAVLWVDQGQRTREGRADPAEDAARGEEIYAVFARPAWTKGPRPYLGRVLGFAVAPVLLAALASVLLPFGRRARWGASLALLVGGAALAAAEAPRSLIVAEAFEIEVARGASWDRHVVVGWTSAARATPALALPPSSDPEPVFFSSRDALDRRVAVRHEAGGLLLLPGEMPARASIAAEARSSRPRAGSLRAADGVAVNESDRDLRDAFLLDGPRASWLGDLPAGSSRTAETAVRISALRSRLGPGPRRALFDFWWHRTDHDRAWLVGFAEGEWVPEGAFAGTVHHGVLVVVPLAKE